MLRAKPRAANGAKDIPEAFRVQMEDEEKAKQMKELAYSVLASRRKRPATKNAPSNNSLI